ncbi:MAG TPA: hypothetical protein VMR41_00470 [Patescibacteria group bacterium]|nr:hypothetical protein [Patescibacteria group bacterium]
MRQYIFLVILCLFTFIEGTVTTMPLVLALLIAYAVCTQKEDVYFLAFISGLLIDLFQSRVVGVTSVFFLCSVFLVLLYQRKYEIASYPFIGLSALLLSFFYLLIYIRTDIIPQVILSAGFAELCFLLMRKFLQVKKMSDIR